ncbi:MAG: hypothetical protein HWN51_00980 [Desulfobacterales bacterium]|nr:hypothetical protein [Desulfobacterales bacterium]
MAIKSKGEDEVVSVYNPTLKAYQEVSTEDLKIQLKSFGLSEKEAAGKIKKLKGEK